MGLRVRVPIRRAFTSTSLDRYLSVGMRSPRRIADVVAFLASDHASYVKTSYQTPEATCKS